MTRASAHLSHQPRRVRRARARTLIADIAIGVLSLVVLLCVGLITPALWAVMVDSVTPKPHACDTIKSPAERTACESAAAR